METLLWLIDAVEIAAERCIFQGRYAVSTVNVLAYAPCKGCATASLPRSDLNLMKEVKQSGQAQH